MDLEERRALIANFLSKCVTYSNNSISRKIARAEDESEIVKWEAYRDFTEHAVKEVLNGDLDDWLEEE